MQFSVRKRLEDGDCLVVLRIVRLFFGHGSCPGLLREGGKIPPRNWPTAHGTLSEKFPYNERSTCVHTTRI